MKNQKHLAVYALLLVIQTIFEIMPADSILDNQSLLISMPSPVSGTFDVSVRHLKNPTYYCDIAVDDEPATSIFTLAQNEQKSFTINNVAAGQHALDVMCSINTTNADVMYASKQFEATSAIQELVINMPSSVPPTFNVGIRHLKNSQYYRDLSVNDQPVMPIFTLNPNEQKSLTISNVPSGQNSLDVICSTDSEGSNVLIASKTFIAGNNFTGSNTSAPFTAEYAVEYCCVGASLCRGFGSQSDAAANCPGGTVSQYSCSQRQNRDVCGSCCEVNGIPYTVFEVNDCDGIFYAGQRCQI